MKGIPENFELVYTKDDIKLRVEALAQSITPWILESEKKTDQCILAVCVLRGAVFFFADLLRALPCSVETSFLRTWAYTDESTQRAKVEMASDELRVSGRAVLLVDEICDSGATLRALHDNFMNDGASEVKAVVAISRLVELPKYQCEWSAFVYPGSEWFVGYGMDSANRFRNAPNIYKILR